ETFCFSVAYLYQLHSQSFYLHYSLSFSNHMEQSPFPSTTFIMSEKFVRGSQRVLQFLALAFPAFVGMGFLLTPMYFSSTTPSCLGILLVLGLVAFGIVTVRDPANVKQRLASQSVTLNDTALQLHQQ